MAGDAVLGICTSGLTMGQIVTRRRRTSGGRNQAVKGPARANTAVGLSGRAVGARAAARSRLSTLRGEETKPKDQPSSRTTTPPNKARLDGLKAKLPTMELPTILGIWRNAVRYKASDDVGRQIEGHHALAAIEREWKRRRIGPLNPDDYFAWPSIGASGGDGSLDLSGALREGMFAYLEYHVGRTNGQPRTVRKVILERVFAGELPPVFPRQYLDGWGKPETSARLKKMAEALAAFVRNAKRRDDGRMGDAIRDWETDLRHLYDNYYVAKFSFGWPDTGI